MELARRRRLARENLGRALAPLLVATLAVGLGGCGEDEPAAAPPPVSGSRASWSTRAETV